MPDSIHASLPAKTLRIVCFAILFGLALITAPRGLGQMNDFNFCYSNCTLTCNNGPGSPDVCRANCANKCTALSLAKPVTPAPYGAIAFGDGGAEGISWHFETSAEADRVAVANCAKSGGNCRIVYRYQNSCAALAKTADNRHTEVALGATAQLAAQNATVLCGRWGKCSSDLSACSFADGARASTPAPANVVSWAAIAFSPSDGQAGWSQTKVSKAAAEQEALANCSQRGKSCAVVSSFNKECGGLARAGNIYGTAVAADQQTVLREATQACSRNGGTRCVIQVLFCSR